MSSRASVSRSAAATCAAPTSRRAAVAAIGSGKGTVSLPAELSYPPAYARRRLRSSSRVSHHSMADLLPNYSEQTRPAPLETSIASELTACQTTSLPRQKLLIQSMRTFYCCPICIIVIEGQANLREGRLYRGSRSQRRTDAGRSPPLPHSRQCL